MNIKLLKSKKLLGFIVVLIMIFGVCIYFLQSEKNHNNIVNTERQTTEEELSEQLNLQQTVLEQTQDQEPAVQTEKQEAAEQIEKKDTSEPIEEQTALENGKDESLEGVQSEDSNVVMCTPDKETQEVIPKDDEFVKVTDHIPTLYVELKYATEDNFTSTVIYNFSDVYLRYGTVKKLIQVQEILLEKGYSLKIWDAFRPIAAQFVLWEVYPDATYVANPNTGFSSHSRGNTLDVTLVTLDGSKVQMPTEFDDFSILADRDYSDIDQIAFVNATLLETVMKEQGFNAYQGEWWHFTDNVKYSVDENFNP